MIINEITLALQDQHHLWERFFQTNLCLVFKVTIHKSVDKLVMSNYRNFSATSGVNRPTRNGTYIKIYERTNPFAPVWFTDCGYSSDCIYTGTTLIFRVQNASWTYGAFYYVLFDSGAVSGNIFCSPESAPILGMPISLSSFHTELVSIRSNVLGIQYLGSWSFKYDNNDNNSTNNSYCNDTGKLHLDE